MGFKAGMTHVVREVERTGSKLHKKDVVEAVTVIECPAMVVVGIIGYTDSPKGLKSITTVWARNISDEMRRRYYKRWFKSEKKAFLKHMTDYDPAKLEEGLSRLAKYCSIIRVIAHTQPSLTGLTVRKAHVIEIQINGGANVSEKLEFAKGLMEQMVPLNSVFNENDMCDLIAINKGKGTQGVVKRWGVTRLPRKTHRGLRKVACIGAWHPARVGYQVARAGQMGFHHRSIINKKIYRLGAADDKRNASTPNDVTEKTITPMGGFKHFGEVKNDFMIVKGTVTGPVKGCVTIRRPLHPPTSRRALEPPNLKFIDTSSKLGSGRFQTSEEKANFFGPMKKKLAAAAS